MLFEPSFIAASLISRSPFVSKSIRDSTRQVDALYRGRWDRPGELPGGCRGGPPLSCPGKEPATVSSRNSLRLDLGGVSGGYGVRVIAGSADGKVVVR
jgi:hypothetical protein